MHAKRKKLLYSEGRCYSWIQHPQFHISMKCGECSQLVCWVFKRGLNSPRSRWTKNWKLYCSKTHTNREREGLRGHAAGRIPTAALNNLRKWFVMFSLELKLNLEVKRQSTKPQC